MDEEKRREQLVRWMREHGEAVLHLAYFYVRDRHMAEDVFQDTFLRVYSEMDKLRDEGAAKTWILRITANLCRDRFRSWVYKRVLLPGDENLPQGVAASAEQEAVASLERRRLLDLMFRLPLMDREVLIYHYYCELKTNEIAQVLRIDSGAVRVRLHRARRRLKDMLREEGSADERRSHAEAGTDG
ncbi:sigma-70 family RNA polymerase sigma factor [Kyrpidia sp.]|uniref:sigma-70 family RNA polymerase sigma factor n=1 Tax=Kyrpidia sp. TaxID=2073077 RepID=UPI00258F59F7|nr:sigma-70 family RNA polymerase sigma factor [Kyrpidia sp.]MCL6575120.1 sigma-70 family RNA polymerase sigma factor [Kyrpidia sp.]